MTDEERAETTAEDAPGEQQPTPPDFAHFGVVIERRPRKVFIPGLPEKFFFVLRAPNAKGIAEIEAAQYRFEPSGVTMDEEGNAVGAKFAGAIDGWGHFLARCYAQVVDFCLPYVNEAGAQAGEVRYKATAQGRNSHNEAVYESLSPALADYLLGAMAWVAGESGGAREAFDELFASSPSLVAD